MSLEIFLSQFFSLHVVWTQQLLRQIKLNSLESLQNYAHKNSWANPVCMKTFPTTFAILTVHHFTPNGHFVNWTSLAFIFLYRNSFAYHRILWQIWNSRTTQQIFIKTYEFLIKKRGFFSLSPIFQVSDELDDLLAAYQMSKHGRKYIIFLQNRNDLEWN